MDQSTPWPRNLYFHIKRREWRARYVYQGKKRMKNFSLKRYNCEAALILGAYFLREMRRRRIPSDSEITSWDIELRSVLPNFRCNAFEFVSKSKKTSDSNSSTPYLSKQSTSDSEFDGKIPEHNTIGDAIIHYHTPIFPNEDPDTEDPSLDIATNNKASYIKAIEGGNSTSNRILEKMPNKFKDAISDINKLLCIASQSVSYIPLGGVFTPDLGFPLKLLGRKRSKIILSSDTDDFGGYILKNELFQDQLSPSNLQDDYFNVCHTLNQLSQEYSENDKPKYTETDFYTYQIVDDKTPKTTSIGKMPSIRHRLLCATNTINTLNKWHNVRITLDKNMRKYSDPDLILDGMDESRGSLFQKNILKEKKPRRKDESEANRIRYISVTEFCSMVSSLVRQVESNLETISQMSKCPSLLDDPQLYIKQSLNTSIPNFTSLVSSNCGLEKNIKIKTDKEAELDSKKLSENMENYGIPISCVYNVNNSLYDHVNSSRFIPKIPIQLKEPILTDIDASYSTRYKNLSPPNKIAIPSNLNFLCTSGLLALINQAQYTSDPDELASIILSAMVINHQQSTDEPKFIDSDSDAKCQKVDYVNGIVVLQDDKNLTLDNNQLLIQHQAQAVAKLKLALSFCTSGNKMTIRGQIGIKISMLMNEVLKMTQHKVKLLSILDKLKHLDKRVMEIIIESENLHRALYYYRQSLSEDINCNNKRDKLPSNYLEELLNLEMLHMVCETIMETKVKLADQIIGFLEKQCVTLDKIIPENLCKAIEIILYGREKKQN